MHTTPKWGSPVRCLGWGADRSDVGAAYAKQAPRVRRMLARHGVPAADLEDLCHDVFLIAGRRLPSVMRPELLPFWLRGVAWRVAVAHRRRNRRPTEPLTGDTADQSSEINTPADGLARAQQHDLLVRAIERLDLFERDALILYALAELPLVQVARLANCDPKTARKRLRTAERRVKGWMGRALLDGTSVDVLPALAPLPAREVNVPPRSPSLPSFHGAKLLADGPTLWTALLGNVVFAVWSVRVTAVELDLLEETANLARAMVGGPFLHVAILEPRCRAAGVHERARMAAMLPMFRRDLIAYATVMKGGLARVVRPVMTALSVVARPGFPLAFFDGMSACAAWLSEKAPAHSFPDADRLVTTAAWLRARANDRGPPFSFPDRARSAHFPE